MKRMKPDFETLKNSLLKREKFFGVSIWAFSALFPNLQKKDAVGRTSARSVGRREIGEKEKFSRRVCKLTA